MGVQQTSQDTQSKRLFLGMSAGRRQIVRNIRESSSEESGRMYIAGMTVWDSNWQNGLPQKRLEQPPLGLNTNRPSLLAAPRKHSAQTSNVRHRSSSLLRTGLRMVTPKVLGSRDRKPLRYLAFITFTG